MTPLGTEPATFWLVA